MQVTGLRELIRDLQRLGIEVSDLKEAMGKISDKAASLAKSFAPRKSGALAESLRASKAKGKAVVTGGRGKSRDYARVQNYGSADGAIPATLFMQQADYAVRPMVIPTLSTEIDRLIAEKGLR